MSIFKKIFGKQKETAHNQDEASNQYKIYEEILNKVYPRIGSYVRDTNLERKIAGIYAPGLIVRETAFVDASSRLGGMTTKYRYVILSNHMANFSMVEHGTNWGLRVANRDSHFKVLGVQAYGDKSVIVLLHLPDDESWKIYQRVQFSLDEQIYKQCLTRLEDILKLPLVLELATEEWLSRCTFPIGMDDGGNLWELE